MTVWLLVSVMGILVALGLLVALVVWRKRKAGMVQEPNYRAFFIMGIAFIPVGFIWMTIAFTINAALFPTGLPLLSLGIIYLSIGLGNRDKWKKS
ncbi:MAG: hypothetical protein OEY24_03455 [Candidatus Bathyarchaeota archaeon]|nr:hypothetical protein [Candidatus Bathyarchaeota archaeon]MDH5494741.1 hypothetical protein [Candidatus Bathyarchaeota archaeon]